MGPDKVKRFIGWRKIPGNKRKWPYELHAEYGDGEKEWVACVEMHRGTLSKDGVFKEQSTARDSGTPLRRLFGGGGCGSGCGSGSEEAAVARAAARAAFFFSFLRQKSPNSDPPHYWPSDGSDARARSASAASLNRGSAGPRGSLERLCARDVIGSKPNRRTISE